jgi:hypothetical protein
MKQTGAFSVLQVSISGFFPIRSTTPVKPRIASHGILSRSARIKVAVWQARRTQRYSKICKHGVHMIGSDSDACSSPIGLSRILVECPGKQLQASSGW